MNFLKNNAVAVIALVIAIIALLPAGAKPHFGAILDTSYFDFFQATTNGGFKVGSNTIINGSGNVTIPSGGSLTVTTTNAATSTTSVGCIQTTATSTATPIRFVIGSVQAATSTFQGTNANFTVLAQYGSCPA